jgi:type IV pilus assembly protein PilE
MKQFTPGAAAQRRVRGFTTIELLIALVILGVLLAVAYPSYQSAIRKSRRAEAMTALSNIQQAQERLRSTREMYANNVTAATTATPPGLGWASATTASGYYSLALDPTWGGGPGATTYVATAAALPGTSQATDGPCSVLAVHVQGGNIRYGAAASIAALDWTAANTDPTRCWAR